MTPAIEAIGLHKTFTRRRSLRDVLLHPLRRAERIEALRGVNLRVERGEIFGLLGPNGAGKTTLLKILSCLVLPDEGRALVGGAETSDENAVKCQIGLVHSDERSFYWRLSGRENLRFFAALYNVPRRQIEARIHELFSRVDLLDAADRPFSDYSSGMKQRMAIARALLHRPHILLMDEPTRSLDPASALSLRTFVREQLCRQDGNTILITTHNLREIEAVADRVAILIRGRVRQVGTVDEVRRAGVDEQIYRLDLAPGEAELDGPFRVVSDDRVDGTRKVTLVLQADVALDDVLRSLLDRRVRILGCDRVEPDLEDAFARILRAAEEESST